MPFRLYFHRIYIYLTLFSDIRHSHKKTVIAILRHSHLICLLTFFLAAPILGAAPSAHEIIKKMEQRLRGSSSYLKAKILIEKGRVKRTVEFESWESNKRDSSFIRILKPKKDRRISFLKINQNLWQYIPKIGKEIKIDASLMNDSWMGSDFTNDDLVRETSLLDDYDQSLVKFEDTTIYKIRLLAKPDRPVVWNKLMLQIRKKDFLPRYQEFYDHKGRLKKKMEFGAYKTIGGRLIPSQFKMMSLSGKRVLSSTTMFYLGAKFNLNIPKYIFSKANLRK